MRIVTLAIFFVLASSHHLPAGESSTNLISIHISHESTRESGDWEKFVNGKITPDAVKLLLPEPILTARDFSFYNPTSHVFGIKPDATQRVLKQLMPAIQPKRLKDGTAVYLFENADLPFALFVSGKPVLVGVFTSPFSSTLYPNQITPLSPAIPAQGAHPATFVLRFTPPPQTGNTTPAEQFLQAIKTLGLSSSSPAH